MHQACNSVYNVFLHSLTCGSAFKGKVKRYVMIIKPTISELWVQFGLLETGAVAKVAASTWQKNNLNKSNYEDWLKGQQ